MKQLCEWKKKVAEILGTTTRKIDEKSISQKADWGKRNGIVIQEGGKGGILSVHLDCIEGLY